MYLSFITGNVLEKFTDDKHNIIYYPQNNMFDHLLANINDHSYYIFGESKNNFQTPNLINLPNNLISLYNYNLSVTNNILGYASNNLKHLHLNSIICTHSHKPSYIKKEDSLLMDQRLSKEIKVFFTESSKESWRINTGSVIKYGIPDLFINENLVEKRKDVLILSFENTPHAKQIQQILLNNNYSCDIMDSCSIGTQDIVKKFNDYNVCVDLSEHNIINLLCAIAAGCVTITMMPQVLASEYEDLDGLIFIESINQIGEAIKSVLPTQDEKRQQNRDQVLERFSFNDFKTQFNSLITKANAEAFIL
jgi:uncharacterized membrane protein YheB (UPF0754 family)